MKQEEWPFVPDHITNDRHSELDGVGIISNAHLEGMLTAIAGRLRNPVTMMEFPINKKRDPFSKEEYPLRKKRDPYRTKSQSLDNPLHEPCAEFQKHYKKLCDSVEYCVARWFRNRSPQGFAALSEWSLTHGSPRISCEQRDILLKIDSIHHFVEFKCPLLPYHCLAIPIAFEQRVIGVFYVGEIILERDRDSEKPWLEAQHCHEKKVITEVFDHHKKRAATAAFSDNKYAEFVTTAGMEAIELCRQLSDAIDQKREKYIRNRINDHTRTLYDELSQLGPGLPARDRSTKSLWDLVHKRIEGIRKDFKLDYIYIFGTMKPQLRHPHILNVVAKTIDPRLSDVYKDLSPAFDLVRIPQKARSKLTTSKDLPELFAGLQNVEVIDKTKSLVRTLPSLFNEQSMLVTWVGFGNAWNPINHQHFEESGSAMETAVHSFYSVIASTHSAMFASIARFTMEIQMRIFGHELDQLSSGLDALRLTFLDDPNDLRGLSDPKISTLNANLSAITNQIDFLRRRADWLIELPEPKQKHFLMFGNLLYKLADMHRMDATLNNLEFMIPRPSQFSDEPSILPPPMYADQLLVEHLVSNIINNAVKYSHRGTRIWIDCVKQNDAKDSPHVLSVTNYGLQMEDTSDHAYELLYRGHNVRHHEGSGIGLYLVKQIVEAHRGTILHTCERISAFNVPLISHYIDSRFPERNQKLIRELENEREQLKQTGDYENIVARHSSGRPHYSSPSKWVILRQIYKPTYRVTCKVTFPAKVE